MNKLFSAFIIWVGLSVASSCSKSDEVHQHHHRLHQLIPPAQIDVRGVITTSQTWAQEHNISAARLCLCN